MFPDPFILIVIFVSILWRLFLTNKLSAPLPPPPIFTFTTNWYTYNWTGYTRVLKIEILIECLKIHKYKLSVPYKVENTFHFLFPTNHSNYKIPGQNIYHLSKDPERQTKKAIRLGIFRLEEHPSSESPGVFFFFFA